MVLGGRRSTFEFIKSKSNNIGEIIPSKKWPQFLASFTANLVYVSVGMNFGWSSPTLPILLSADSPVKITVDEAGWITSILPLGDFIGAPLAAVLCNLIGRKRTILLTTIPHLICWLLIAFAMNPTILLVARFIAGISEGASFICIPMYLGEIAEPKIRGALGSFMTLSLILGIFLINVIGSLTNVSQTALISSALPLFTLITFSWMPLSPYYCVLKNKIEEARHNLKRLRRTNDVEEELLEITKSVTAQMQNPTTIQMIFTKKANRKAWFIMAIVRILQQLCGISAVTYYLIPIFNDTGMNVSSLIATTIYLFGQIIATIFCIIFVDKFGRKPLMIISLVGTSLSLFVCGGFFFARDYLHLNVQSFNLVPLCAMICYIVIFSLGYGTIPTLLLSELFATNIKSKALCTIHFIFAFFLFFSAKIFLLLQDTFGSYVPFWLYGTCAILAIVYTHFFVPETKGKTLDEIQRWLEGTK